MSVLTERERERITRAPCVKQVCYGERLAEAPRHVLSNVLSWHAELCQQWPEGITLLSGEEQLVWAEGWTYDPVARKYDMLGALLWSPQVDGCWWVELGYVVKEHREEGVYKLLWEQCVWYAQQKKVRFIQGSVAYANGEARTAMAHLGRRPSFVVYDFDVEAHDG